MGKAPFIAIMLSGFAAVSLAQAPAPADAASAPAKHKLLKKLRNHKPAASAVDPERTPFKKGGQ